MGISASSNLISHVLSLNSHEPARPHRMAAVVAAGGSVAEFVAGGALCLVAPMSRPGLPQQGLGSGALIDRFQKSHLSWQWASRRMCPCAAGCWRSGASGGGDASALGGLLEERDIRT